MKRQVMWFWFFLCVFLFASCEKPVLDSKDDVRTSSKERSNQIRMVRIHPKELRVETFEEMLEARSEDLSRASGHEVSKQKLYAVNVYEKKPNDESYSMYAYGLFNKPSTIAIRMNKDNLYKVECLIVEEGDDRLRTKDGEYLLPFKHGNDSGTKLMNSFVFSKDENLSHITKGETSITDGRDVEYPRVTKLYGTFSDFSPMKAKDLTIDMRKASFGLNFKVLPPEEGSLVVNYVGWRFSLTKKSKAYNNAAVYSFRNIAKACQDNYQTTLNVKITWTKDDGTVEEEIKELVVKRNVMTVVEISVEGNKPQGFSFNEESTDMKIEDVKWNFLL